MQATPAGAAVEAMEGMPQPGVASADAIATRAQQQFEECERALAWLAQKAELGSSAR